MSSAVLCPRFHGHRAERQEICRPLSAGDYFAPRVIKQRFDVGGIVSPDPVITWVRPLEACTQGDISRGLCITGLADPNPSDA